MRTPADVAMESNMDLPQWILSPEALALADVKILATLRRTLERLDSEADKTIKNMADPGHEKSIKAVARIAKQGVSAIENIRNTISNQYYWVILEIEVVKQPQINLLMANAQGHLQKVLQASEKHLREITALVKNPLLFEEFYPELSKSYEKARVVIRQYVNSYAEQKYLSS